MRSSVAPIPCVPFDFRVGVCVLRRRGEAARQFPELLTRRRRRTTMLPPFGATKLAFLMTFHWFLISRPSSLFFFSIPPLSFFGLAGVKHSCSIWGLHPAPVPPWFNLWSLKTLKNYKKEKRRKKNLIACLSRKSTSSVWTVLVILWLL